MMGIISNHLFSALIAAVAVSSLSTCVNAATTQPLSPLNLPIQTLTAPTTDGVFTFVAGGDNRATSHGEPMPPSGDEIFKEISIIHPALVIWTGDEIEGYDDTLADADGEYKAFLGMAADANTPVISIPGNHEISFDPNMEGVYKKDMGALYGSFDYAGSHFIGLDSCPVEADSKVHDASIDPDQMAWLTADLAANQNAANIFVFFHHYMFGPSDPDVTKTTDTGLADPDQRDQLHQLFVKYHVRAVFNGHSHINYHVNKDGVDYYIAGNAGAPLDASPENGGYLGYTLVHVNGSTVTTEALTPWTLFTRSVSGNDGKSSTSQIAVSNYTFSDLDLRGVSVVMPKASGYAVAAETRYKGKAPSVDVTVDHVENGPKKGTSRVFVVFKSKHARTTFVTVTAAK